MNRRCAAALALLVWYLLLPPLRHDGTVNMSAPLSKWKRLGNYDTSDDCETALSDIRSRWVGHEPNFPAKTDEARCISSDDPRLKEK